MLIDCVFALIPSGRILHFHIEQFDVDRRGEAEIYRFNGAEPAPERARCQVIPPLVNAFGPRQ